MSRHSALQTTDKSTRLVETTTVAIKKGELMTQPLFVGVCGTDLQIIRRQRPDPATILGHEGVARVLNGTTQNVSPGDLVVFNPVDPTDQNQILGHNIPGLLQERYVVSEHAIENDLVVPFPADVDPLLGALVEPLGTVVYGHSLVSKVVKQSSIAIVGAGAIGIMHALYAKSQNYDKIFLINASKEHLDWCVERGIIEPENTFIDSDTLAEEIMAATGGAGVDAVYMCTSRPNALMALSRAVHYVKPGGCIDLVGGIKDGDTISVLPEIKDLNAVRRANFCGIPSDGYVEETVDTTNKQIYITGHRGTSFQHFTTAIEGLQAHDTLFRKVISHIVSLEAAPELFNEIAKGQVREYNGSLYIKAVVDMSMQDATVRNV